MQIHSKGTPLEAAWRRGDEWGRVEMRGGEWRGGEVVQEGGGVRGRTEGRSSSCHGQGRSDRVWTGYAARLEPVEPVGAAEVVVVPATEGVNRRSKCEQVVVVSATYGRCSRKEGARVRTVLGLWSSGVRDAAQQTLLVPAEV